MASCTNHLFLLDSILERCKLLESCPFLPGCQICWHIIIHRILSLFFFFFFVFLHYQSRFFLFHFLFCLFEFSLVFFSIFNISFLKLLSIRLKRSISFSFSGEFSWSCLLTGHGSSASSFYLYFSYSGSLGETIISCGLGGLFIHGNIHV